MGNMYIRTWIIFNIILIHYLNILCVSIIIHCFIKIIRFLSGFLILHILWFELWIILLGLILFLINLIAFILSLKFLIASYYCILFNLDLIFLFIFTLILGNNPLGYIIRVYTIIINYYLINILTYIS